MASYKLSLPHRTYSENKVRIKQIIKKYGLSWEGDENGWINKATGDGVYIDKSVMEMILSDSFTGDLPMTMIVRSDNAQLIEELERKVKELGGEFGVMTGEADTTPAQVKPATKQLKVIDGDIFYRRNIRDERGCNTPAFMSKVYADLQNISKRWERRKKQLLWEYRRLGMEDEMAEELLRREEIAFRKRNACWVTGEFPDATTAKKEEAAE